MAGMPQTSDTTDLPGQLAILPFRNRVLLPGGIVRIRCTSASSVRLIEQELWQKEESGVIGVVPVRDAQPDGSTGASVLQLPSSLVGHGSGSPANGLDELEGLAGKDGGGLVADSMRPQRLDWHDKGVAAQALHLSRGLEKPGGKVTYTVVLEGRCRFAVNEMTARGPYLVARVSQLDMTKTDEEESQ
ncbi:hypothetical protein CBR_g31118 [Chara braunii]|uniref:Lon N-terminal domain-containing protein n=1 Tax=Chara braunii TaxID=69332 RepID=A0A388LEC9_CHABU|nr:hypothetical protein CBR_g31118 [Chara braunii]|eukprot:GBG80658.1 hypothetical protein CBR_g31118 [Chara braunii]